MKTNTVNTLNIVLIIEPYLKIFSLEKNKYEMKSCTKAFLPAL